MTSAGGSAARAWIERCAGVLAHVTSLPDGRLDAGARFARYAAASGFRVWQILPTGPVDRYGSPYLPDSAFAGNADLLGAADGAAAADRGHSFAAEHADWLPDYALFRALRLEHGGLPWYEWPARLRDRAPAALEAARARLAPVIADIAREQHAFDRTWRAFKADLNAQGLKLFGDVPLFLAHDSADAWTHRELFQLDANGLCEAYMGVPPDAFSATGQDWGCPPYRWEAMRAEGFRWWTRRFAVQARRFDLIRIDHFRGLAAYWRIPRGAMATEGAWTPGPGRAALDALGGVLGDVRLVAEDLGYITDDVVALRKALGLPGMRVLQFAFDSGPDNPHLPQHHGPDCVVYTGTHDNDTTLGWWRHLDEPLRNAVRHYLGQSDPRMPEALVECAWASPAPLAVVPLQDLMGLGSEARMNTPGTERGNWRWRFDWPQLPEASKTRETLLRYRRLPET
ncbi:MAG: 4-alpha-glucanotransferase [Nevskia sp.]|nr:4-alpha-glucanotransferase [Nevskia sp.]